MFQFTHRGQACVTMVGCCALLGAVGGCTPLAPKPTRSEALVPPQGRAKQESESVQPRLEAELLGPAPVPFAGTAAPTVRFLLDSDSAKLLSQRRFWLFARFEIPAGSHIYWENPGESGLATQVSFIAPPEVTIGTVQYPGPTRFAGYGSTTSYGYSNQVVLAAPVTVVADVDHPLEILASASWLSCSDVCVKEHAEARLILPPTRLTPAHQAPVLDLLPRPLPSGPQPNERGPGQTLVLRAPPDVELVEFFPLAPLGPEDDDCTSVEDEGGHSLRVQLRYDTPLDRPITGVVRALVDGQTRYFSVVVD